MYVSRVILPHQANKVMLQCRSVGCTFRSTMYTLGYAPRDSQQFRARLTNRARENRGHTILLYEHKPNFESFCMTDCWAETTTSSGEMDLPHRLPGVCFYWLGFQAEDKQEAGSKTNCNYVLSAGSFACGP
jgi:hypothetical protein